MKPLTDSEIEKLSLQLQLRLCVLSETITKLTLLHEAVHANLLKEGFPEISEALNMAPPLASIWQKFLATCPQLMSSAKYSQLADKLLELDFPSRSPTAKATTKSKNSSSSGSKPALRKRATKRS